MDENDKAAGLVEIRKYSNRRLYDPTSSKYVTLADVAVMIREGKEIRVVDAKSGEDLTRATMLQIISESKDGQEALPLSLLRRVIGAADRSMRDSMREYLSVAVGAQQQFQQQMTSLLKTGMMFNPLTAPWLSSDQTPGAGPADGVQSDEADEADGSAHSDAGSSGASPNQGPPAPGSPAPPSGEPTSAPGAPPPPGKTSDPQIEELKQQLAALQQKIDQLGNDR